MLNRKKFLTLFACAALVLPAAGAFAKDAKPARKMDRVQKTDKEAKEKADGEGKQCPRHPGGCCKGDCPMMGMMKDATTVLIVKHKVKDYEAWRKVFDADSDMKDKGGVVMAHVLQSASDPTDVTVIGRFKDEETAKKFISSPDLKAAMEKSGVVGEPQFTILKDVTGAMCPHGMPGECCKDKKPGECRKGPRDGSGPMGDTNECPRHKEMMEKMEKGGDKAPETKADSKTEPKKDEKK